jgi:hypothetical protein
MFVGGGMMCQSVSTNIDLPQKPAAISGSRRPLAGAFQREHSLSQ